MILETKSVEKPWGVTRLPSGFADAEGRRIGEIWFDQPGEPLPLLVKWLFTSERLSIQVHPNDDQARERGLASGKEECWVIAAAEPDARLGIGTIRSMSGDELRQASLDGSIEDLMDWKPVRPGDYFYIPAGTVHAIGAGISLVEVQQNADITYRLYDYGRPRELHLDDGVTVSKPAPYGDARSGRINPDADEQQLVDGPLFDLWNARGEAIGKLATRGSWLVPMGGTVHADGAEVAVGSCLYLQDEQRIEAGPDAVALIARNR
ncbi:type I phosphomannose isomerase catalytic subunit [Sphingomonas sp. LY29]|uniref:type I phosphomannose isomerase catalytic subunit n=1 Tax=Sphingomonas sp. LY29 TaxID=3095341 RepID=UPI002D7905A8|nr:type I phosphomannose isomerase catalytic subunit [Sphingomonas sp. LY29]WRP26814.1 type I phosphomannose isomerase catalytic subunit [Sphingomonas sp. LY29]